MSVKKVALLFPGQGACYPGVLMKAADVYPEVGAVFADIDAVATERLARTVTGTIWGSRPMPVEELITRDPDVLQLAIFATSVAVYRVLEAEGLRPDVLMGHSFGEIAAMVCGGAFSVTDGARIVCDRTEASRLVAQDGYMAAFGAGRAAATRLVDLLGNHDMVLAGENSDTQTVLSGVRAKMDRASEIARILNVGFFRLNSPYPFHSPLMEPVRDDFARRLQRCSARQLQVPVFSPILGRYYQPSDSLTDCLAGHLVQPVAFAPAVRAMYAEGVRVLVECGALDALTKLATKAVQAADVTTIACLPREGGDVRSLSRAIDSLRDLERVGRSRRGVLTGVAAPSGLYPADANDFWSEYGPTIRDFVDEAYAQFRERQESRADAGAPAADAALSNAEAPSNQGSASVPTVPQPQQPSLSRETVFRDVVSMYAAALEYPEEVFSEKVELEAELGIDSVKQTELLARVADVYQLPARSPEFRLADYPTMGSVVDFVMAATSRLRSAATAGAAAPAYVETRPAVAAATPTVSRAELFGELTAMYAAALEYPVEVFTEDVALEAELGIDSVKQTELFARAAATFGLPPRSPELRLADYGTMGKVVDFIHQSVGALRGASAGSKPTAPGLESAARVEEPVSA